MTQRRQVTQVLRDQSFKGRQFTVEVILWAVRWYLMFPISYRDLELMLLDRGVPSALVPASIAGSMRHEISQAASNTLKTVAVRRRKWNLR